MNMVESVDRFARLPTSVISSDLTLREFKVYASLAWHKMGNATCWPSIATISGMCGIDERNVTRTLKKLEVRWFIRREFRDDEGKSTLYRLFEPDGQIDPVAKPATRGVAKPKQEGGGQNSQGGVAKSPTTGGGQIAHPEENSLKREIEQDIVPTELQASPVRENPVPVPVIYGDQTTGEICAAVRQAVESSGMLYDPRDERKCAAILKATKQFAEPKARNAAEIVLRAQDDRFWAGKINSVSQVLRHWRAIANKARAEASNAVEFTAI